MSKKCLKKVNQSILFFSTDAICAALLLLQVVLILLKLFFIEDLSLVLILIPSFIMIFALAYFGIYMFIYSIMLVKDKKVVEDDEEEHTN